MNDNATNCNFQVDFILFDPSQPISKQNGASMFGPNDLQLLKSFCHSRNPEVPHQCNSSEMDRYNDYTGNAGAVLLYDAETMEPYNIPGNEKKEYHTISDRVNHSKYRYHSYGHSERILMRDILDDLILSDLKTLKNKDLRFPKKSRIPPIPSLNGCSEAEVLQNLTERASEYRYYLKRKKLVVKMWSERGACADDEPSDEGSNCRQFMHDICPQGSKCGYIRKDYKVEPVRAFKDFMKAFREYEESEGDSVASGSASDDPAIAGGPEKKQKVK